MVLMARGSPPHFSTIFMPVSLRSWASLSSSAFIVAFLHRRDQPSSGGSSFISWTWAAFICLAIPAFLVVTSTLLPAAPPCKGLRSKSSQIRASQTSSNTSKNLFPL
ncbi:unnamed protein product, partial [Musa acuminata var. zebrina]